MLEYRFRVDAALTTLSATVCFGGSVPSGLAAGASWAKDYLRTASAVTERGTRALPLRDGRIVLAGLSAGQCVSYTVDLGAAVRERSELEASRHGEALLTNTALWLWRPLGGSELIRATARFELPEGVRVDLPWPKQGELYQLDSSAFRFYAFAVLGRFEVEQVSAPGATLEVAVLDGLPASTRAHVVPWLRQAARAASQPFGAFPRPSALVVVVPCAAGHDAVRFGNTNRGGGASFVLLLPVNAELEPLLHDWVAVHEFSHLLHPFVDREDAWFSEGLATYYQEIARVRAGMESAQDAWRRMYEGAQLGRRAARSLSEESATMFQTMSFRTVYWAGAGLALMSDVELRRRTHGRLTLDRVLHELRGKAHLAPRPLRARHVLERLDRIVGQPLFSELARRWVDGPRLPSLDELYAQLGLSVHDGSVQVAADADEAWIREAIMARDSAEAPLAKDAR